jgi:fatty acid desaturase
MQPFGQLSTIVAFLRSESPQDDVSTNPVVAHPHNSSRTIPERLPAAEVKALSQLDQSKSLLATAEEWAGIAAAIALCTYFWNPALYLLAVLFIGARQHALMILGHDASHYRYLRTRALNDLFGNLLLMWPTFASVEGFRKFHATHHQYTSLPSDGNRHIWHTHNAQGELEPEWVYPKTLAGLALVLLRRAAFLTGILWILRGLVGSSFIAMPPWMVAARIAFYGSAALLLTAFGAWGGLVWYWLVPYCTWHIAIQYARLICEHSAIEGDEEEYSITRTTIPTWLESVFILPRNVGFHLEHHWYPSVPFYRLPELHRLLMAREGFKAHAVIGRSVTASLGECIKPQSA